ncbi:MAG TPA: 4'-phosphopantetheinyl transferase superfamily protein [Victivallales bacterium]|nr:4'-phosphopantetheinyl transferase superfamily protein [Victivallales bacterium]
MEILSINIQDKTESLNYLYNFISKKEIERCKKYRFSIDRLRAVISCLLKRFIIENKYIKAVPEISMNSFDKPYFKHHPEIKFNLSHSGDCVIIAVSDYEVGIDCEVVKESDNQLEIAKSYYSKLEYEYLLDRYTRTDELTRTFFDIWTKKESFIKAIGKGLSHPLTDFTVPFGEEGCINYDNKLWYIKRLKLNDTNYKAAVCSETEADCYIKFLDIFDLIKI